MELHTNWGLVKVLHTEKLVNVQCDKHNSRVVEFRSVLGWETPGTQNSALKYIGHDLEKKMIDSILIAKKHTVLIPTTIMATDVARR